MVFALQLEKSIRKGGKYQLINFVRYKNDLDIIKQFLFCQDPKTTANEQDIFHCVNTSFVKHNISWDN